MYFMFIKKSVCLFVQPELSTDERTFRKLHISREYETE